MNNKGQSLVTFMLLIPIFLLVLYMVYEIGRMASLKNQLDSINYLAVSYAVNHMDEEGIQDRVRDLINKNKSDIDNIQIDILDNKIYVTLRDKLDKQIFSRMGIFSVKSTYVGYIQDEEKIIERDK